MITRLHLATAFTSSQALNYAAEPDCFRCRDQLSAPRGRLRVGTAGGSVAVYAILRTVNSCRQLPKKSEKTCRVTPVTLNCLAG
jgi:hypothetical protein